MSLTCILLQRCRISTRGHLRRRSTTSSLRQLTLTKKQPFMLLRQAQPHTTLDSCAVWLQRIWLPRRARRHEIGRLRTTRTPCPLAGPPMELQARRLRVTQASRPMRLRLTTLRLHLERTRAQWCKCRRRRRSAVPECLIATDLCTSSSPTAWLGTRTTFSRSLRRPICRCIPPSLNK